jgi:hypothetical protein
MSRWTPAAALRRWLSRRGRRELETASSPPQSDSPPAVPQAQTVSITTTSSPAQAPTVPGGAGLAAGTGLDREAPPDGVRDPGIDLAVATAVLSVARRLTSAELQRRLAEAVASLPDITVVFPAPGEAFDPDLHSWEEGIEAPTPDAAETIAETRSAGLLDHGGLVRRRAGVVVYETKEKKP